LPDGYFVTGTDTEVGKTLISLGLLRRLRDQGHRVAGMKPVASGATLSADGLRNEDALALQRASSQPLDYALVNPYCFEPPVAPHIAAQRAGITIELDRILDAWRRLAARTDRVVVEGVGGWLVPLGTHHTVADLAQALGLPVILVVGLRLGCINHALLTAQSIRRAGVPFAGWVANGLDPAMAEREANIAAIGSRLEAPLLAEVPRLDAPVDPVAQVGRYLNLGP
jgi:dethiobiotin synthetase